jgi:hypothetical protein
MILYLVFNLLFIIPFMTIASTRIYDNIINEKLRRMSYDGIKAFNMPKCKIGLNYVKPQTCRKSPANLTLSRDIVSSTPRHERDSNTQLKW